MPPWVNGTKTSLSLLELLLRLTSLQQFQQQSHLSITDELLNFFLEESASTGAGGDENYRQALRQEARRRVGWDPYDESPMKRRGEEYQYYYNASPQGSRRGSPLPGLVNGGGGGDDGGGAAWSPLDVSTRTSDFQGMPASPSPSSLPMDRNLNLSRGGRASWLKRQDGRKGSPLRPQTALTDEGIGTSPALSLDKGNV